MADEVTLVLGARGIKLVNRTVEKTSTAGILLFHNAESEFWDSLASASRGGRERILALAASPAVLASASPWRILQAGAAEALAWDAASRTAAQIVARLARWEEIDGLIDAPLVADNLIGCSRTWTSMLRQVVEVARFSEGSILLTGESGTGKELAARLVHSLDQRHAKRDLVVLDCTTIVPELAGSEFFGHERGAFTGAVAAREGAFALADGGTLFLDEVGELPPGLQAQLLRVIQERTYKRVGGNVWHKTTFRLVCATNRNLADEVRRGAFRADLYYRIADWTLSLPPLRERPDDIQPLALHFVRQACADHQPLDIDPAILDYLLTRDYPGNIRDLRQVVWRMVQRHVGPGPISVGDIPAEDRPGVGSATPPPFDGDFDRAVRQELRRGAGLKEIRRTAEEAALRIALDEEGSLQRAAQRLRVSDRALQMRRAKRRGHNSGDPEAPVG